jgi:pimeloyl-ACP methyl ester carboxylesterase
MLKEQTFDADGVTINFAEGPPSGPPLLLIHGGGGGWQGFLPIIPHLVLRWHVYGLDLRGHGKSDRVPGQYRPEHYVPDVVAFLERQLTEPVLLFGHSLGGWKAMLHAQAYVAPDAGHGWSGEAPDLFAEMVRAWTVGQPLPERLQPVT